jgi:segregation and condensation protein B
VSEAYGTGSVGENSVDVAVPDETEPAGDRRQAPDEPGGAESGRALTEADLEALLFIAERPLARREIASLAGATGERVDELLGDLEVSLTGRGIRLVAAGDRVALATAPETGGLVGRYVGGDPTRLSPAMLETLAIVVYRQPVTRAVVERIRGVDSDYVLRVLLHRRLVVELGRAPTPGRPFLYGTGYEFLERFGLASLDDLPVLEAEIEERLRAAGGGDGGVQAPVVDGNEGVGGDPGDRAGAAGSGVEAAPNADAEPVAGAGPAGDA